MGAQELRILQEAYLDVYEGFKPFPHKKVQKQANKKPGGLVGDIQFDRLIDKAADFKDKEWGPKLETQARNAEAANRARGAKKAASKNFGNRLTRSDKQGITDSYDLYDIILLHLLDEGYAETPEAAEKILMNMSEEWRQSILG